MILKAFEVILRSFHFVILVTTWLTTILEKLDSLVYSRGSPPSLALVRQYRFSI